MTTESTVDLYGALRFLADSDPSGGFLIPAEILAGLCLTCLDVGMDLACSMCDSATKNSCVSCREQHYVDEHFTVVGPPT